MKEYTKQEAVAIITQSAQNYQTELVDKKLLIICVDKHKKQYDLELSFYARNFLHLTGVKAPMGKKIDANRFFQQAINRKLNASDFDFAEDGTTHLKLAILPSIVCGNLCAKMCGDYNSSKPRLYTEKLVGGVKACMGFVQDTRSAEFRPNTLIKDDIREVTRGTMKILAVYRKDKSATYYEDRTYLAKGVEPDDISHPKIKKHELAGV